MHRALLPASSLAGLSRGGRRLFECGTPPALFARAHAPGAHLLPAEPTLKDPQGISLLSAAQFEALAAAMGLHAGSPAPVFYDDAGSVASARAAWVFRYWGVGGAQLVDGGWQAIARSGGGIEVGAAGLGREAVADELVAPTSPLRAQPVAALRAGLAEVCRAGEERWQLVDARSPREFSGEDLRGNAFGGRPPGAVSVPHSTVLTREGVLAPQAALVRIFADAGLRDVAARTIVYCQAGIRASLVAVALGVAGFKDVAVYDESMREYLNREDVPRER